MFQSYQDEHNGFFTYQIYKERSGAMISIWRNQNEIPTPKAEVDKHFIGSLVLIQGIVNRGAHLVIQT